VSKIGNTTVRAATDVIREVIAGIKEVIDTVISSYKRQVMNFIAHQYKMSYSCNRGMILITYR
jgi:hypothetical protein